MAIDTREKPVPFWKDVPQHAQQDLAKCEFGTDWFDQQGEELRLTVLNLYVKLRGMKLWSFVGYNDQTSIGCMQFKAADVRALKRELDQRGEFSDPNASMQKWVSRERRAKGSLHFKHFDGWPEERVQAHVDRFGLACNMPMGFVCGIPLGIAHLASLDSYEDVFGIREILIGQGWDNAPLVGLSKAPEAKK